MAHTFANLLYHFVFSTKDRRRWINDDLAGELHRYLGGALHDLNGIGLCVGGTDDHVHIFAKLPPTACVSDILRDLKANASGWIHRKWPELAGFAWQIGFGAFSVSASNAPAIRKYIANQAEHHRVRTFQEEFIVLLKKNGIAYDERYIWE